MTVKKRPFTTTAYKDAPSGFVYHLSYPGVLDTPYTGGHGFLGVLLFDKDSHKVQCHYCGGWYETLGQHIQAHKIKVRDYKKAIGLFNTRPLHSPTYTQKLLRRPGAERRLQSLVIPRRRSKETIDKIRKTLSENRIQYQTVKGVSANQLIKYLRSEYERTGRTPHTKKIKSYLAIINRFGSYKKACEAASIPYFDPKDALVAGRQTTYLNRVWARKLKKGEIKYTVEQLRDFMRKFRATHKRSPTDAELRVGLGSEK